MRNRRSPAVMVRAFLDLFRVRIVFMSLVACSIAFILAYRGNFLLAEFCWTLIGGACLSGGALTLNCYLERDLDALMPRTKNRPIPAGVIEPKIALLTGLCLNVLGCVALFGAVNFQAGVLGLAASLLYLAVYTPSKRLTWLNTSIGALPGAAPPLIGWAAARGHIDPGGWILFLILFLWQHVHFLPIAWLYRDDYQKAGFRMLPVLETSGKRTFRLTLLAAVMLLLCSVLLYRSLLLGIASFLVSSLIAIALIVAAARLVLRPSTWAARTVLKLSLLYLPVLLATVVFDRYGHGMTAGLISSDMHDCYK